MSILRLTLGSMNHPIDQKSRVVCFLDKILRIIKILWLMFLSIKFKSYWSLVKHCLGSIQLNGLPQLICWCGYLLNIGITPDKIDNVICTF